MIGNRLISRLVKWKWRYRHGYDTALAPRAYLQAPIQGFLHLHPALPAYSNNNNSGDSCLTSLCQHIHHNCKQERDQSRRTSPPVLTWHLVSAYPGTCPLPLSHPSLPLQIPSYNAICLILAPCYTTFQNPQTRT